MGFSLAVPQVESHQHSNAVGDGGVLSEKTMLNSATVLGLIVGLG
jgi:hypothetical protein